MARALHFLARACPLPFDLCSGEECWASQPPHSFVSKPSAVSLQHKAHGPDPGKEEEPLVDISPAGENGPLTNDLFAL